MDSIYKTKEEAEAVALKEFGEAVHVGKHWVVRDILLTADEVSTLLDVDKRTVWNYRAAGELPDTVHPTPGKTRWRLKDFKT